MRCVKRPEFLWNTWGPSRSLDQFTDVDALWVAFKDGEVDDEDVVQVARPPLERMEQQFRAKWRNTPEVYILASSECEQGC